MQNRIKAALSNPKLRRIATRDFNYTFKQLGLGQKRAFDLTRFILSKLEASVDLPETEREILAEFERTMVGGRGSTQTLPGALDERLAHRADLIYSQLAPHLREVNGSVLDFGCGDAQVTQLLHDRLGLDIEGVDVRHYPSSHITVPVKLFDGKRVPAKPGKYSTAVITNVLHHEKDNENILGELSRLNLRKIVVIETVPVGKTSEQLKLDHERTFLNDYLYNRLFHNADVPVPGTYETPQGWIDRFQQHGFRLAHSEDLGVDQPTIRDTHHLLVFER